MRGRRVTRACRKEEQGEKWREGRIVHIRRREGRGTVGRGRILRRGERRRTGACRKEEWGGGLERGENGAYGEESGEEQWVKGEFGERGRKRNKRV